MTATIDSEKILDQIRDSWAKLARDQTHGPVLRACSMTLVVISADDADDESARRTLNSLQRAYPCRAILLRPGHADEARVFTECRAPFGASRQVCSERIEIEANPASFAEMPRLLRPLFAPDVPVLLWCRGPAMFSGRSFDALFSLAQKIIVDSFAAPDPNGVILKLAELHKRGLAIADLAWTRLTAWREAVANEFECSPFRIQSAHIQHGGSPGTNVLYLKRWIEHAAPGARIELQQVPGDAGVHVLTLAGEAGRELRLQVAGASALEIRCDGHTSRLMLPASTEAALIGEEFSIAGLDRAFEAVLF